MAPLTRGQAKRAHDEAASADRLPDDVLFNVLQLLPAKDVCRVRAVSKLWRSTASHPAFIRAHVDRHKEPRFLAKFRDDLIHVYVVDLSGNVLKRIFVDIGLQVMGTRLNRACLGTERNRCCLLNPATGGTLALPHHPAVEHVRQLHKPYTFFGLGFVASTREYKVLRAFIQRANRGKGVNVWQFFEVLTINGDTHHAQWRAMPGPPLCVDLSCSVVLDGVVYFMSSPAYRLLGDGDLSVPAYYILSFDLEGEEWKTHRLQLPTGTGSTLGACLASPVRHRRTLANLKGSLVLVHHHDSELVMDLWFLQDFESGLWAKEYSIQIGSIASRVDRAFQIKPILVLGDGRLVIYQEPTGVLFICDPRTNTFTQVHMRRFGSVDVYTGSLLSVQEGDME